jgi:hypothetical protein
MMTFYDPFNHQVGHFTRQNGRQVGQITMYLKIGTISTIVFQYSRICFCQLKNHFEVISSSDYYSCCSCPFKRMLQRKSLEFLFDIQTN